MKRIIITGTDGFVGRYLIPKLLKSNYKLLLIGRDIKDMEKSYGTTAEYLSYIGLAQEELRQRFMRFSPDIVIHLATYYTVSDKYSDMEKLYSSNLLFLGKILDALKQTQLICFIYTGSCTEFYKGDGCYDPAYLYSATKTAGRSIIKYYSDIYEFKYISLTPYTVYGGIDTRKKIIDYLYDSLNSYEPINATLGKQILDFIHVEDLTDLFLQIVENIEKIPHRTNFQAGTGIGNSLRTLVSYLEKESQKKANVNWGGISYRKKDTMYAVADITLQNKLFNWYPKISLEDGVKLYIKTKNGNKT